MEFQMQICSILRFSWSILVKCCVHLQTSSSKTLRLLLEKNIFHKYWLFCYRFIVYIWPLWPLDFYLFFVNNSYSVVQSALMTGFRTDFTSSVWNFCRWVADVPPRETSPATRREKKQLFWQAIFCTSPVVSWLLTNHCKEKLVTQQPSFGAPWVAMALTLVTEVKFILMYSVFLSCIGIQQEFLFSLAFLAS